MVLPLVGIFAIVVISMTSGLATPTESSALGALPTVILAACYRQLSWESLWKSLLGTASISGSLLFIIVGATTFAQLLSFSGATAGLVGLIESSGFSQTVVLIGMLAILLVLGFFIDQTSIMMVTLPFYMPLLRGMGVDLVWFGILYLLCMQIGLLTPPFGLAPICAQRRGAGRHQHRPHLPRRHPVCLADNADDGTHFPDPGDRHGICAEPMRTGTARLVAGRGRYTDDIDVAGLSHAAFLRSPYPHARIEAIDMSAAERMPGVVAVLTADDLATVCAPWQTRLALVPSHVSPPQSPLAKDEACWQGEAVVAVVATSRALAEDAAEQVEITWTELPAIAHMDAAAAPDAPRTNNTMASNLGLEP